MVLLLASGLCLTTILTTAPADSNYFVPGFRVERVFDQPATRFWEPAGEGPSVLAPDSLAPETFILRRKSGSRDYSLFPGRMRDGAYGSLFAFRLDSMPRAARLRMKFYSQRDGVWFRDLEDIYFQDDLVFAGQPLLYCRDGEGWKELKALPRKPIRLALRSSPPGAAVFLDGRPAGTTPVIKSGLADPYVLLRMELPGHYGREEPVNLAAGPEVLVEWTLHPLLPADALPPGDSLPLADLVRADAPNLEAYEARQGKIRDRIAALEAKRGASLARFDSLYPPLKPREEFEKSSGYDARKTSYVKERGAQERKLTREIDKALENHREAAETIDRHRQALEKELLERKVEGVVPDLQRYDPDLETYPFRLVVSQSGLRFEQSGRFILNPETARKVKGSPDSVLCRVRFWNLRLQPDSGGFVYMAMDSLACAFQGRSLRIEDAAFGYPAELTAHPSYARIRDLQGRFESERREAARRRIEEDRRRETLARKARWRKRRLGSALGATAVAAFSGYFAFLENSRAESKHREYRNALSPQGAASARKAVETHDRNALLFGIGGGLTLAVSIPFYLF